MERNPNKRYSAIEAFDELNKIKNIYLNKQLSQIIKPQIKFLQSSIVSENSNKKMKYFPNPSINHKFKRIFNDTNNHLDEPSEEKEEKNDDNSIDKKEKSKMNNNEIRIMIKKKNK